MCSSAKRFFSPHRSIFCSTINIFVIHLEGGLENPQRRVETREKVLTETSFHLRIDGAKNGQKQARDESMQEDYIGYLLYIFCRCPKVFLHSFISGLFLSFLAPLIL